MIKCSKNRTLKGRLPKASQAAAGFSLRHIHIVAQIFADYRGASQGFFAHRQISVAN